MQSGPPCLHNSSCNGVRWRTLLWVPYVQMSNSCAIRTTLPPMPFKFPITQHNSSSTHAIVCSHTTTCTGLAASPHHNSLEHARIAITRYVEKRDHIPPITSSSTLPFPFDLTTSIGWGGFLNEITQIAFWFGWPEYAWNVPCSSPCAHTLLIQDCPVIILVCVYMISLESKCLNTIMPTYYI